MDKCHLVGNEDIAKLNLRDELEKLETIFESSHFDVWVSKCKRCGQLFICVYKEVCLADGEDDNWNFWVPVSKDEIDRLHSDGNKYDLVKLLANNPYICEPPTKPIFWSSQGNPLIGMVIRG